MYNITVTKFSVQLYFLVWSASVPHLWIHTVVEAVVWDSHCPIYSLSSACTNYKANMFPPKFGVIASSAPLRPLPHTMLFPFCADKSCPNCSFQTFVHILSRAFQKQSWSCCSSLKMFIWTIITFSIRMTYLKIVQTLFPSVPCQPAHLSNVGLPSLIGQC